jgi:hypothetical protein
MHSQNDGIKIEQYGWHRHWVWSMWHSKLLQEAHSQTTSSTANHTPLCDNPTGTTNKLGVQFSYKDHWLSALNSHPSAVDGQAAAQDTSCSKRAQLFITIHILMWPNLAPYPTSPWHGLNQTLSLCNIWGSQGGQHENDCLLDCSAMWSGMPADDEGSKYLWNISKLLPHSVVLQPRRQLSMPSSLTIYNPPSSTVSVLPGPVIKKSHEMYTLYTNPYPSPFNC